MRFKAFVNSLSVTSPIGRRSEVAYWLVPELGHLQLEEVSPSHVAHLLDTVRESGVGEARVHSVLQATRAILKQARLERLIFEDPTAGFKVKVPKAQVNALTAAQRDALDAELYSGTPHAGYQLLRVILWTGLRISEAMAISPADYDHEAQTLRVRKGKSDAAARTVDVPDCLATDCFGERLPFTTYHATTIRRALHTACAAAGVPQVRVHDLRHTRITTMLMAGVPVGYVSKQAGHASAATTLDTYDQWVKVAERDQVREWANS